MSTILGTLFLGLSILASHMHVAPYDSGYPTVISEIARLVFGGSAGGKVAIVSNSEGMLDSLFTRLGLRASFDVVADSGVLGVEKPDPRIFAACIERMNLPPSAMIYAGDDPANDVVAPRIGRAARELVAARRRDSAIVVLTTATNRVITELTAEHLGIGHLIATECERDTAGRFTGRASGTLNMREGKVARLHEWLAERGELLADYDSWAYSDSINDLPLLEAADHAVVVHADERLARLATERGWPSLRLHGPDVDE